MGSGHLIETIVGKLALMWLIVRLTVQSKLICNRGVPVVARVVEHFVNKNTKS